MPNYILQNLYTQQVKPTHKLEQAEAELNLKVPFGWELIPLKWDICYRAGLSSFDFLRKIRELFLNAGISVITADTIANVLILDSDDPVILKFQEAFGKVHFIAISSSSAKRLGHVMPFALYSDKFDIVYLHGRFITRQIDADVYMKYAREHGFVEEYRRAKNDLLQRLKEFSAFLNKKPVSQEEQDKPKKDIEMMKVVSVPLSDVTLDNASTIGWIYADNLFKSFKLIAQFIHRLYYILAQMKLKQPIPGLVLRGTQDYTQETMINFFRRSYFIGKQLQEGDWQKGILEAIKLLGLVWSKSVISASLEPYFLVIVRLLDEGIKVAGIPKKEAVKKQDFLTSEGVQKVIQLFNKVQNIKLSPKNISDLRTEVSEAGVEIPDKINPYLVSDVPILDIVRKIMQCIGVEFNSLMSGREGIIVKHLTNLQNIPQVSKVNQQELMLAWTKFYEVELKGLKNIQGIYQSGAPDSFDVASVSGLTGVDDLVNLYLYIEKDVIEEQLGHDLIKFAQFIVYFDSQQILSIIHSLKRIIDNTKNNEVYKELQAIFQTAREFSMEGNEQDVLLDRTKAAQILQAMFIFSALSDILIANEILKIDGSEWKRVIDKTKSQANSILQLDEQVHGMLQTKIKDFDKFIEPFKKANYVMDVNQVTKLNTSVVFLVSIFVPVAEKIFEKIPQIEGDPILGSISKISAGGDIAAQELADKDLLPSDIVNLEPDEISFDLLQYTGMSNKTARLVHALSFFDPVYAELFYDIFQTVHANAGKKVISPTKQVQKVVFGDLYNIVFKSLLGNIIPDIKVSKISYKTLIKENQAEIYLLKKLFYIVEQETNIYQLGGTNTFDNVYIVFITVKKSDIVGGLLEALSKKFPKVNFVVYEPGITRTSNVVIVCGSKDKPEAQRLWAVSRTLPEHNVIGTIMTAKFVDKEETINEDFVNEFFDECNVLYQQAQRYFRKSENTRIGKGEDVPHLQDKMKSIIKEIKDKLKDNLQKCINITKSHKKTLTIEDFIKCLKETTEKIKQQIYSDEWTDFRKWYTIVVERQGIELKYSKLGQHFKGIPTSLELAEPEQREDLMMLKEKLVHDIMNALNIREYYNIFRRDIRQQTLSANDLVALNLLGGPKKPIRKKQKSPRGTGETEIVEL